MWSRLSENRITYLFHSPNPIEFWNPFLPSTELLGDPVLDLHIEMLAVHLTISMVALLCTTVVGSTLWR
jgi:hypothetical protein